MRLLLTILLAVGLVQAAQATEVVLTSKNTVVMDQAFTMESAARVQHELATLASQTSDDLYLVLNSPGGSIGAGMRLIDFAKNLPNKVHTITIFAASMAYLTAQHLDKRYVTPDARLMSHRARIGGLGGQVPGEANSRLNHIQELVDEIFETTAKRVGVSFDSYMSLVYDELWLTATQAIRANHADDIIKARCDESLSGTQVRSIRTFFGTFKVTLSKCPLIVGPLGIGTDNMRIKNYIKQMLNYRKKRNYQLTL